MKRYLVCLVALLLLFSAYCRPFPANAKAVIPVKSKSTTSQHLLSPGTPGAIDISIANFRLADLPDPLPPQIRYGWSNNTTKSPLISYNQHASWKAVVFQIKSPYLTRYLAQHSIYAVPNGTSSIHYPEKKERSGFGRGAAIGAIVGTGIGAIAGYASSGGSPEWYFYSPIAEVFGGILIGALIGVIIGGTIGVIAKKRRQKNNKNVPVNPAL